MTKAYLIVFALLLFATVAHGDAGSQSITIGHGEFSPATITVHAGDTVTWVNNDDSDHTILAGDGSFQSGTLKHGEQFQHKFTAEGTVAYSDGLHPRMKGTVVVAK